MNKQHLPYRIMHAKIPIKTQFLPCILHRARAKFSCIFHDFTEVACPSTFIQTLQNGLKSHVQRNRVHFTSQIIRPPWIPITALNNVFLCINKDNFTLRYPLLCDQGLKKKKKKSLMTTLVPIKSVGSQEYSNSMEALDARETFVHIFLRNFEIPNKSSSNSKEINIQKIPRNIYI